MKLKSIAAIALSLCLATGCSAIDTGSDNITYTNSNETIISLSDDGITVDGNPVFDQSDSIFTNTRNVFVSRDVVYYEDKDVYESGYPYGLGNDTDKHTVQEAAEVVVLNITKPGIYRLSGTLSNGQIRVDLGKLAYSNKSSVVNLILDNADITCKIAPAIIFENAFECNAKWSVETASRFVDTSKAGANITIADGSVNTLNGSYVPKIFKDQEVTKKKYKYDGTINSAVSLNINGENAGTGVLNIYAGDEGISSDLHLTINGGNINIFAQDDGINTNEEYVSVTTLNGGNLFILGGLGSDGDGVDSNGWFVINGGTVVATSDMIKDNGLDGYFLAYHNYGGTVLGFGGIRYLYEDAGQLPSLNLQFLDTDTTDKSILVTKPDGTVVFAFDLSAYVSDSYVPQLFQDINISCPNFEVGETYNVYKGGKIIGKHTIGVYDSSTVTGFEGATQQCFTGNGATLVEGNIPESDNVADDGIPKTDFTLTRHINNFSGMKDYPN